MESTLSSFNATDAGGGSGGGPPSIPEAQIIATKTIGVVSLTVISLLIIGVVLQTRLQAGCCSNFRQKQMGYASGKILYIIFMIAFCLSFGNCIVFVWAEFNEFDSDLSMHVDPKTHYHSMLVCRCLYDMTKWLMSVFFILRLKFVLQPMANLRVSKWILLLLVAMCTASLLNSLIPKIETLSGNLNPTAPHQRSAISYSISLIVDIAVMALFARGLAKVIINLAIIEDTPMSPTTQTHSEASEGASSKIPMEHENPGHSTVHSESMRSSGLQKKPRKVTIDANMISVITKATLLSVIGMSSSCILIFYLSYLLIIDHRGPSLATAFRCVDGVINVVCMYLVFGFNSMYYRKGCRVCDAAMSKCCTRVSERAVVKAKRKSTADAGL